MHPGRHSSPKSLIVKHALFFSFDGLFFRGENKPVFLRLKWIFALLFCAMRCCNYLILQIHKKKKRRASFSGYFFDKSVKYRQMRVFGVVKMRVFGAIVNIWGGQNEGVWGNSGNLGWSKREEMTNFSNDE